MQINLECRQCGGVLERVENQKIVYCKYCGSANAISIADRFGLYNRANYLRRKNEFDRAIGIYEDILKEDPNDAEAYFGIALCKYGIEYVEDPFTEKKIPTCHRTRITLMTQDSDFQKAIANADPETAQVYIDEATKIDGLIRRIQQLSAEQEKYDIFICYKESNETGERTQSSVFAQDIYNELEKQGYKVFFARKTLEQKLGSEYEPIIFAALYSAKVMLVIGTESEQFQAVWVRNEWSRYLERIANGDECTLIPVYRDISPYDLPKEFANLQALDMGKIGFMQDLQDGIQKLFGKDSLHRAIQNGELNSNGNVSDIEGLRKRAFLFLEQGDFNRAENYFERVLDKDPEDAEGYWGKLLIEYQCKTEADLEKTTTSLESSQNYQLANRFATPDQAEKYKRFENTIKNNIERKRKEEQEAREAIARANAALQEERALAAQANKEKIKIACNKAIKKITKTSIAVCILFCILYVIAWFGTSTQKTFYNLNYDDGLYVTYSLNRNHLNGEGKDVFNEYSYYVKIGSNYYSRSCEKKSRILLCLFQPYWKMSPVKEVKQQNGSFLIWGEVVSDTLQGLVDRHAEKLDEYKNIYIDKLSGYLYYREEGDDYFYDVIGMDKKSAEALYEKYYKDRLVKWNTVTISR